MGESAKTGSEEFGDVLRRARERLGMSRRELAEATGLSYPYISQLETGYRTPSSPAMRSLADALGMGVDTLFDAIPPSSPRDEPAAERITARPARRRAGGPTTPTAAQAASAARPPSSATMQPSSATMRPTAAMMPAAMPAPTPPVPAPGGAPHLAASGIVEAFGPPSGGWIDNERYGPTASSDAGSGAPMADSLLGAGPGMVGPEPDADLIIDQATVLLTSLPTGNRLAALGEVQDRVVRSVVEDRLRAAGRPG